MNFLMKMSQMVSRFTNATSSRKKEKIDKKKEKSPKPEKAKGGPFTDQVTFNRLRR